MTKEQLVAAMNQATTVEDLDQLEEVAKSQGYGPDGIFRTNLAVRRDGLSKAARGAKGK